MTVKLVFSCTDNYLEKMAPFLRTVNAFGVEYNVLMTVGFDMDQEKTEWFKSEYPHIAWRAISDEQNAGAPVETYSIQHGSFVPLVSDDDSDVLIYSDGDIVMQRPLTNAEMFWVERFPDNMVSVGYNSGPAEKLVHEAMRLRPKGDAMQLVEAWGDMVEHEPCFNLGVMIARAGVWKRIHAAYMELYDKALDWFGHGARQQWLVCYVMAKLGIGRHVMPYTFHTHNHYGLPSRVYMFNGLACIEDRIICFRHRF